jgi:hypothetical protein
MPVSGHLVLQELLLQASAEWAPVGRWTVARVAEGAGYCLGGGFAKELNVGDMVLAGAQVRAVFRSSQLGDLRLQYFHVLPECLEGLVSIREALQLEDPAAGAAGWLQYFPASEPAAQKFTRLAAACPREGLALRAALLQLWAATVSVSLRPGGPVSGNTLRERFRQYVEKVSEAELTVTSLADLAAEMHCSERHLSRLFREEFKMSLRDRQSELRLRRARPLPADPAAGAAANQPLAARPG